MEFEVSYKYTQNWIPPRCRKPRLGVFDGTITVDVQEIAASEAPWACVVHGYRRYFDEYPYNALRYHDGRFYERAMKDMRIDRKHCATDSYGNRYWWCDYETELVHQRRGMTIEEMVDDVRWHAEWNGCACQDEVVRPVMDCADSYLIVNGEVWHEVGEPMYCINTFGLGHNHGGTSWFVEHAYNGNISNTRYFNANEFERMVERFFDIALGRGDTDDAHRAARELADGDVWNYIEVIEPSFFTHRPMDEHGEGDPFMNAIDAATSGAGSAFEAGAVAMAMLAREVA